MQAPPTPLHRATYPIPVRHPLPSSRRATSSRPESLVRIIAGTAAIATATAWSLDDHTGKTGGAGWVVLAYWAGKVVGELRDVWRDTKGRRKDGADRAVWDVRHVGAAGALALQSVTFVTSLQAVGPLKATVLGITGALLGSTSVGDRRAMLAAVPAIVGCAAVIALHAGQNGAGSAFSTLGLWLSTAGAAGTVSELLSSGSRKGRVSGVSRLHLSVASGAAAAVISFFLWAMGFLPMPLSALSAPQANFLGPFIVAALARYIPLPFSATSDPRPAPRLRTSRDNILLLFCVSTIQLFAMPSFHSMMDLLFILPLVIASLLSHPSLATAVVPSEPSMQRSISQTVISTSTSPWWSLFSLLPPAWRPHMQTILNTPASRRIFYFLLLNLAYMGVQMAYGVLTNSLGLISDGRSSILQRSYLLIPAAIHMLFDCLGIGVGLWASVAATWKPDAQYTFGYSRVETLSGFANGCFLILISIFIIFEAIQRVIDPPEMDTHQLLLVSVIGLVINLFGMWATGGHHHHHHHGDGDGHGHGHSHAISVHSKKEDHRHHNGKGHHQTHSEGHSNTVSSGPDLGMGRRRSSGLTPSLGEVSHLHTRPHSSGTEHAGQQHDPEHNHGHKDGCEDPTHRHAHAHSIDHNHGDVPHLHMTSEEHSGLHEHDLPGHAHESGGERNIHEHDQGHYHGDAHDHDHDHDAHLHGGHAHSHNMRGVFLHVMADTLGSVGVIISTILIKWTGWTGFDPIASLFIAALITASVIPLVIDSAKVLMLDVGKEKEVEIRSALAELSSVEGLSSYGAPRFWPRCEGELVGSIHIQLATSRSNFDPTRFSTPAPHKSQAIYTDSDKVVARVEKVLKRRIKGLTELVVQIEGSEEKTYCSCMTGGG